LRGERGIKFGTWGGPVKEALRRKKDLREKKRGGTEQMVGEKVARKIGRVHDPTGKFHVQSFLTQTGGDPVRKILTNESRLKPGAGDWDWPVLRAPKMAVNTREAQASRFNRSRREKKRTLVLERRFSRVGAEEDTGTGQQESAAVEG